MKHDLSDQEMLISSYKGSMSGPHGTYTFEYACTAPKSACYVINICTIATSARVCRRHLQDVERDYRRLVHWI